MITEIQTDLVLDSVFGILMNHPQSLFHVFTLYLKQAVLAKKSFTINDNIFHLSHYCRKHIVR